MSPAPKISVIIPVYNGEKHLKACLMSLFKQSLHELEILVIDNGSTDSSGAIIKNYMKMEPRLKCITMVENGGVSMARNIGLENALGEYIAFCDCDDIVPSDAYQKMYQRAVSTQADVVVGNYKTTVDNIENKVGSVNRNHVKLFEYMQSGAVWNRIFRHDFINCTGIRFLPYNHGEDTIFIAQIYAQTPKISGVRETVYNYITHPESLAHSYSQSAIMEYIEAERTTIQILCTCVDHDELVEYIVGKLYFLIGYWWKICDFNEKEMSFTAIKKFVLELNDQFLELPYQRIFNISMEQFWDLNASAYIAKIGGADIKEIVRLQFAEGEIGFCYIAKYFIAWFLFKLFKRGKRYDG